MPSNTAPFVLTNLSKFVNFSKISNMIDKNIFYKLNGKFTEFAKRR